MKPLIKKQLTDWQESMQKTFVLGSAIEDRISYVIKVWVEAFGGKLSTWYFSGAEEGEVGNLENHIHDDSVGGIVIECNPQPESNDKHEMVILTKDGGEWAWDGSFPSYWLFEDCEDEIINGKKLYEAKLLKKKADAVIKKSLQKKLDTALVDQAKAKLTPEELKALKKVL